MTEAVAAAPEKSVKRMGWALLALALASPALMGAAGILSAYKVGELTAQIGFAWLAAAIVIDLLTRKRDAVTKANGRIVAAVLALVLVLVTGFNVYRDDKKVDTAKKELIEQFMASSVEARNAPAPTAAVPVQMPVAEAATPTPIVPAPAGASDADKTVAILAAMKVRAKQFAETSVALDRKFSAVDLTTVLSPQSMLGAAGIRTSRTTLEAYKGLIRERGVMLDKHFAATEQIMRGAGLSERELNNGLAGINSSKRPILQTYADLDAAQLASVKASMDILNFAERGLGRMTAQNGKLMFQTQPELSEYRRLMQVLTDVAAKEDVVTRRVAALQQKSKQSMADQLK